MTLGAPSHPPHPPLRRPLPPLPLLLFFFPRETEAFSRV